MAGHSAWKNIKHKKARVDARRGKIWSKCARAIIAAARQGGGDPAANLSLRYAIEDARFENMPKDTIENAIRKGTGAATGENYENAIYEGYGPGGVAMMLEILTDNRNRTAPEVRGIFDKAGGNLGATGCVAYMFQQKGQVLVPRAEVDEETLMTTVLDAGAEDVSAQGEDWCVLCALSDLSAVQAAVKTAGITVESAGITMVPINTVTVTGDTARKVLGLIEALEDHDDVQKVHANCEIPEEELAALT